MHAADLADSIPADELTVNSLHPATFMPTKIVLEERGAAVDTLELGTRSTLRLALDPALDGVSGRFFDRLDEGSAAPAGRRRGGARAAARAEPGAERGAMAEALSPALRAVSDAVLAVASQLSVEEVLQRLVDRARELAGARYAALGIPDGEGGFSRFLVAGMSDELIASMGPLPRTHGMLGAMLEAPEPFLTDDIHADPRFRGWWPAAHPDMRSFLGVPIVAAEGVIGAFYLTEKEAGRGSSPPTRR